MTNINSESRLKTSKRFVWLRSFRGRFAFMIVLLFVSMAIAAPWVAPYDPYNSNIMNRLQSPSSSYWFGTDEMGRDIFSRIVYGSRVSLIIGIASAFCALLVGSTLGAFAAYYGGRVNSIIMRIIDIMLTIPQLVLAIAIVSIMEASILTILLAVTITAIPIFARLTRATFLQLTHSEFVEAAKVIGNSDIRIIFRHIFPNALSPLIVQVTLSIATSILTAAALSFLGLGVAPPTAEWGSMLSRARPYITYAPHVVIFPGLAISLLILAFNMLGDSLRDSMDPYSRDVSNR